MSHIPREPTAPPAFDPNHERYWDARDLEAELRRTYQICHECRMCVTYCGSFPILFDAIDADIDAGRAEGAEAVTAEVVRKVTDHCWQCKLCYIKCPYTPDEKARELLDFPRLMAREKAQRARRDGIPLVDRVLGEPRLLGALGSGINAAPANFVNANRLARKLTEKVAGISADFPLPPMAKTPFGSWFATRQPAADAGEAGKVVLFATCYGEYNFPDVPRAAVQVLEHNGFEVLLPDPVDCCGMPNLDGGDVAAAKEKMARNVRGMLPLVRQGYKIVTPGPTCGYTMKQEWPVYLASDEAKEVAAATRDLMEFLDELRREKRLRKDFQRGLGKVAYHAACHLRAQKIALPGARLLGLLPETEVRSVERCSAVDGTWGMKAEYYAEGRRYARRMATALAPEDDEPDVIVTDCSLAGQRILAENGVSALHPIVALRDAYDIEAGARPLETEKA
ncbi:MAG: heterodisulfide reductase-related iron-sulfur binding cluster [Polyangiaceae bacterium]